MDQKRVVAGKCKICHGDVVEKIVREFNPMSGPIIIGPGSKSQFVEVSKGFHCTSCGIKYEFPPK